MSPAFKQKPAPTPPPAVQSVQVPSRMSLQALVRGKQDQPAKVTLYGVEGIGKTTFAAGAPKPIFLGEDGTSQLDVTRFPMPETWQEVLDAVRLLANETHDFETLVVDTLDWAEPLLWAFICARDKKANIEDYGFHKGYGAALDEWRVFLGALESMRRAKRMHVILVAHSWIKTFKNPEAEDYDRYQMSLNDKAAGLIKQWSDAVLFANYETFAPKDVKTKRVRGVDTGARLLYTMRRAAYDAKNRYGLHEVLPLAWADFAAGMAAPTAPDELLAEIDRKLTQLGGDQEKDAREALGRANGDAVKLAQLNNWANAKLAEQAEKEVA